MKLSSSHLFGPLTPGLLADSVNDASSTRNVYLLAVALAALGCLLLGFTVWFWRTTRPEPELLAPLEKMGERRFRQLDGRTQREMLDAVRPEAAQTIRAGVTRGDVLASPEIDLEALSRAELVGYDDLREPVQPTADDASVVAAGVSDPGIVVSDRGAVDRGVVDRGVADFGIADFGIGIGSGDVSVVDLGVASVPGVALPPPAAAGGFIWAPTIAAEVRDALPPEPEPAPEPEPESAHAPERERADEPEPELPPAPAPVPNRLIDPLLRISERNDD
ncbi:unannotated protein [freshwater metagenome]|uniref:Unannotated protein n=1 Tax=freshwater metagenome TaxID=449393 RepID=A0A6J7EKH6_9ZZZZ|nr:hypothetical protein [Actinomycetota bacterium]